MQDEWFWLLGPTRNHQSGSTHFLNLAGLEYAFVHARNQKESAGRVAQAGGNMQDADFQDLFHNPTQEEIEKAKADLAELGLSFESDSETSDSVRSAPSQAMALAYMQSW